ncbi:MAG: VOC family protein [Frankiaceae bacterium]|nr:VOC family protein [Frankiaceae bacterium]MBV9872856.1 VOC family protein [Frankiaceae bacterium]
MPKVHHSAICTRDVESSLRFWCDGLGFVPLMDLSFEGDWPTLFNAATSSLRSVFLGDPADSTSGIVELVDLGEIPSASAVHEPVVGFFLLSVYADVDEVLARLAALGLGGVPTRTVTSGVAMACVTDPNGVRVELIDAAQAKV